MIDVIFLVGGEGSRLREVLTNCPKPLAPIRGRPFLDFLIDRVSSSSLVGKIILATGYLSDHFALHYKAKPYLISQEKEPLGTGGALKKALLMTESPQILVLNGDSYLEFSLDELFAFHQQKRAEMTLCIREVEDVSRYGSLTINEKQRIVSFEEKNKKGRGWINGGVYLMEKSLLDRFPEERFLSLEKECLPELLDRALFAYPQSGYFIDIGTKDSYAFAQQELLKFL